MFFKKEGDNIKKNVYICTRITHKSVHNIFAQILLSNQHLVREIREIKEQCHVIIGVARKRRFQ